MLRLLGFNEGFRPGNRLEAKLTRYRWRVAGLNADVRVRVETKAPPPKGRFQKLVSAGTRATIAYAE
jgi:hypothetical protein